MDRIALYNDSFQNEIWKPLIGYEDDYEVSDMGRVRSITKVFECFSKRGNHKHYRTKYGRILKPSIQNSGYEVVWLSKNGKVKAMTVHRLIAQTFLTNKFNYYCVNHKNGNKCDNRLENLEWCTSGENLKHAYDKLNRVHRKGTKIICIELNKSFENIKSASEELDINKNAISNVLAGRAKHAGGYTWKEL